MKANEWFLEITISYNSKEIKKRSKNPITFENIIKFCIKEFKIKKEDENFIKFKLINKENEIKCDSDIIKYAIEQDPMTMVLKIKLLIEKQNPIKINNISSDKKNENNEKDNKILEETPKGNKIENQLSNINEVEKIQKTQLQETPSPEVNIGDNKYPSFGNL